VLLLNYTMTRPSALLLIKATLVVALFLCIDASAQKQDTDAYFLAFRNNEPSPALLFAGKKEDQYIKAITPYLQDTLATLRAEAYIQLSNLGQQSKQKGVRKKVVNLLTTGWHDADWGIRDLADDALTHFQKQDFDRTAIDSITARLTKLPSSPGKLFKLIGYLDLRDLAPQIRSYVEDLQPPLQSPDRWAGYISLARMGDQQAIDFLLNRIRTLGLNNDVAIDLFPDLVYTRTFRAIHYLEEALFNNDKNCGPASAEFDQPVTCAYRIMEMLAPALKDYPIAIGPAGELVTTDYAEALEKTRAWFKQKNGNYEIIRDTF